MNGGEKAVERRSKVKERQCKGKGGEKAVQVQTKAVERRQKVKNRQWKGSGSSRNGSGQAVEGQGKTVE